MLKFIDVPRLKFLLKDKIDISFIDKYFSQYDIRNPFQIDLSIPESFQLIKEEFIDSKKYYYTAPR